MKTASEILRRRGTDGWEASLHCDPTIQFQKTAEAGFEVLAKNSWIKIWQNGVDMTEVIPPVDVAIGHKDLLEELQRHFLKEVKKKKTKNNNQVS